MTTNQENHFAFLSDSLANAVEQAAGFTVLVNGRRRMPASGFVYASNLVLTADHVIEQEEGLSVFLGDGTEIKAVIAGRDPGSDLALLRLEESAPTPAGLSKNEPRVGELALALARPSLQGIQASLAFVGEVGGPVRTGRGSIISRYLRTDATPYPGFSGGPLVNARGLVTGINTSGLMGGVLWSIPAPVAWQVADQLAQYGHIRRAFLGIRSQTVEIPPALSQELGRDQKTGLLLVGIESGGTAAEAGLMVGDILLDVAGHPVSTHDDLVSVLTEAVIGSRMEIHFGRGGKVLPLQLTIGEMK